MNIVKSHWTTGEHNVSLSVPLTKVDKERRLVSGFASLDNVDTQGDVVLAEASAKAFSRARGNLREMHNSIAVGKVVDFKEDTYYDTNDDKFYQGIYVTAYVSKGAQDTWEKVLDGTLSGFSIGGNIREADEEWNKDAGKAVRFIKDYDLLELSLVDNPANQLANVFAIQKMADGNTATGVSVVETENVFYCNSDEIAKTSKEETLECSSCGDSMTNIGWFERNGADVSKIIKDAVSQYTQSQETAKGGVIVANEDVKNEDDKAAVVEETVVQEPVVAEVEPANETAVEVSETEDSDLSKVIDNFRTAVEDQLRKNEEEIHKAVTGLDEKFDEFSKGFEKKFEELSTKHTELTEKLAGLKDEFGGLSKSVDSIESSTALKKSGDLGGSSEEADLEKASKSNFWGSAFLGE